MNRISSTILIAFVLACGPSPGLRDESGTSTDTTSESDTDTDTTSSDSTSSDSSSGFLVPDSDLPPSCDPFSNDCPEGEKCVPYATTGNGWDTNKCVPVLGDHAPGEPCNYAGNMESTDDCDATSFCWNVTEVDGELVGTCHALCTGTVDTPECPEGSYCAVAGDSSVTLCSPLCDPLAQDCGEGTACYWLSGEFLCTATTTNHPPGAPCGSVNDCAEGNLCITAEVVPSCEGSACCASLCQLGLGDAQCAALPETVCAPFFEDGEAPPGQEDVGLCMLPP